MVRTAVIHPSGEMLFVEEVKKKNQYGNVDKQLAAFMFQASDGSTHKVTLDALKKGHHSSDRNPPHMEIKGDYLLRVDEDGSFNAYRFPSLEHVGYTLTGRSLDRLTYDQESVLIGKAFLTHDVDMLSSGVLIFDLENKDELTNSRDRNSFKNKGHSMQLINGNLVLIDNEHIDIHSRAERILTSAFDFEPTRRYDNVQGVYRFLEDTDGSLFPCFKGALGKVTGERYTRTYKVTEKQSPLDSKKIVEASRF